MANTPQTETQSVLDHGESVWRFTQRILSRDFDGMRIPQSLIDNFDEVTSNLHSYEIIQDYNILHDCGKPYCIEYDEDGRKHFPNHAHVSKETYLNLNESKREVADLIGWDMLLHSGTADEIKEVGLSKYDAHTLLITSLSEIHSNASMFGGIESISFKSKWKKLDRRSKMILRGDY